MKAIKYPLYIVLFGLVVAWMTSCEARKLTEDDVFLSEDQVSKFTEDGTVYTLNDFLDTFMTEEGSYHNDTTPYRDRANDSKFPNIWLFSVDTIPSSGPGIYIRGRVTTDDFAGNFYKSMVIQQIVGGEQQNLRISVDLGSSGGMYQTGQEIIIRCNGLCVGRYANQPQLCVPSYNDNIYASHHDEKVGWAPGRIPSGVFRNVTRMIGLPDQSKLQYDEMTLADLYSTIEESPSVDATGMDKARKADGRLVRIKNVWFTGQYNDYGDLKDCTTQHPDSDKNANVFAPTTGNVGYPQGRVVSDGSKVILCSTSEYAKYATYYLPGANKNGVSHCKDYVGTVTGILGWYLDNAGSFPGSSKDTKGDNAKSYKYNWSITPRGIKNIGVEDIIMFDDHGEEPVEWIPKEYDPKAYQSSGN